MRSVGFNDVIAAISTPAGRGGIGIVRISGEGSIETADKIFQSSYGKKLADKKSHTVSYGTVLDKKDNKIVDEVLVTVMKAPKTYTKEDVVEINCHGGMFVVQKVLELCLNAGARLAEPGEFTKRAFLNGRIDLTQAEAVIDIINAQTELSRNQAVGQLEGSLKKKVGALREKILDMTASIEAIIDYPEHDIEEETYSSMEKQTNELLHEMNALLENADKGRIIREGIETVILGKPNVGKSSLLNYFLGEDRAIVTDIPGTTRDTVEEYVNIEGIPVKIVDTAGIRSTTDLVEKMGVEKSRDYALKADLILMMIDTSRSLSSEDMEILQMIQGKTALFLLNKIDLESKVTEEDILPFAAKENIIPISVSENTGLNLLTKRLTELFFGGNIGVSENAFINNARQKNAMYQAKKSLERVLATIRDKMPEDFISMDLQDALRALGEITGETVDEEIIDRIFTKFCLGK